MMGKNNHQQLVRDNTVVHYKAYKVGKHWVFAGITALTVGAGLLFGGSHQAQAATTATPDPTASVSDAGTSSEIQGKTVTLNATSTADTDVATQTPVVSDKTASNTGRINTANSTSDGNTNTVDDGNGSDQPGEAATSSISPQPSANTADTTVSNSAVDSANSSIDTNDAAAVSNAGTQPDGQQTYKTPPVKSGVAESASIAPTTDTGSTKVTTSGTNFTLNFTAAAGDKVEVLIDGADVAKPLFSDSYPNYMSVSNVTKAAVGVNTTVNTDNASIVNDITHDGSYSQSFDLKLNSSYIQYSPSATAKSTVTVDRKIIVNINGVQAANYTYTVDYNVVPIRLLQSANYKPLTIYDNSPVEFTLPSFGLSDGNDAIVATTDSLTKIDAKTAEFRISMPDGFKLDEAATAALNAAKGFNVIQDPASSDMLVQYDLTDTSKPAVTKGLAYVIGSFTGYVADTSVTATKGNVFTVVTNSGETFSSTASNPNIFNYKSQFDSTNVPTSIYDYSTIKSTPNTEYVAAERASSTTDALTLSLGTQNYYGPAVQQAISSVSIPDGFTTKSIAVNVPLSLLNTIGQQTIPYDLIYSDGTKASGTLTAGTSPVEVDPNKTVTGINYHFSLPASAKVSIQPGLSDPDSHAFADGHEPSDYYAPYSLPTTKLTVAIDTKTSTGNYQFPVMIAGVDNSGKPIDVDATQTVSIIDSTYVSIESVSAKRQTSTSAGDNLTPNPVTYDGGIIPSAKANLKLSDGTTSTIDQPVALFIDQPIFYVIAPAQTHLVTDESKLLNGLPGAKLTQYTTATGLNAYKVDLTQAISQYYSGAGPLPHATYTDDQSMGVPGVFKLAVSYSILQRLVYDFDIQADPDAIAGTDTLKVYYTANNQVRNISNGLDTNGAMTGDPTAVFVPVNNPNYTIKNMSGIYGITMVQGSNDTGYSRAGTTSVYQPIDDNQFAVNVQNLTGTGLANVSELINLPTNGDALKSQYNVQLTKGAISVPTGVTVSYSTQAQDQQTGSLTTPDSTGYVSADDVKDWSAIKSILIQADNLAANTNLGRVVFNIQDPNQLADIGKTAYFDSGTYADGLNPIVLNQASAASMTIGGKATIKYAYQLPDGTTISAPTLTQTLNVGQDTLKVPFIKSTILPTGYRLINPTTGLAITSTTSTATYKVGNIVNSDADYSSLGGENGTAVIGQVATYDFDGDTVLIPVVDTATQTVTVNYIDDTTQTILASKVLTGASLTPVLDGTTAYVTTPTINNYVKAGYRLVSDATNGASLTFDDDLTQSPVYDVHLTHTTTVVTPTTPGTPGNLIPNTTTQWPAGVTATDLNKTITRTINYVYGDDQSQVSAPVVQTATFTRDAIVDNATGTVLGYLPDTSLAAYKADPTSVALSRTDGWSAAQTFTKVDSPTTGVKTGYVPDQTTVAALDVAATDPNSEVKVSYAQVPKSVAIVYYDENNADQVLEQTTLNGYVGKVEKYDTTYQATLAKYEAMGYVFDKMTGNALSNSDHVITYTGTDTPQSTAVYLKHATIAVTPDQPVMPGSDMPNTTAKWPTETGDLSRTISQVVNYVYDDGTQVAPSVTQSVTYQRAAIVDAVTGDFIGYLPVAVADNYVSYDNNDSETQTTAVKPTDTPSADDGWTITNGDANFTALTSPAATKAGYTADLAVTNAYTARPSTGSAKLTVTYTPDQQLATVSYIDDDANGAEVHVDTINGVTAGTNNYSRVRTAIEGGLTRLGYAIVGTTLPTGNVITFDDDANTPQTYLVHLKHQTVTVTPDQPKTPGTTMPSTDVKWSKGIQALDLNRTVTQTTSYVYAAGGKAAPDITQTVAFQRAAIVDRITGQLLGYLAPDQLAAYQADPSSVTLTSDAGWQATTSTTFNALSSPTITGYTPDFANTADYQVTPTTGDLKLTVTYNPDQQTATVTYVDDDANGAQVHQDTINGVSNGTHDYSQIRTAIQGGLTRLGYTIVGTDLPTDNVITFDTDDATPQQFIIHLKHQTIAVTPDQPGRPGEPIVTNDPDGPKWPAGADKTGLERVVTETVHYVYDKDGQPVAPTVTDTVTFTRTGTVDLTNGQITYTDWIAKGGKTSFTAKPSPVIPSYLASVATVPAVTGLTPASSDVTETVSYKALGGYTTNLPNVPTITYPNDPTDAGKTTTTVIPNVPGYQPVGPNGQPLQPVDPGDLTKGYVPPVITDPYIDTPITYQPTATPGGTDSGTTETPVIATAETPATAVTTETPISTTSTNNPTQPANPVDASVTPGQSTGNATTDATTVNSVTSQSKKTGKFTIKTNAQAATTMTQVSPKATDDQKATTTAKLPQTDEQSATGLSLLGLSLFGLLGLGKVRRRKED